MGTAGFQGERGRQLRLLRYATGSGVGGRSLKRLTRWVTKPTALLVDHLQSVGNFGQHQDDEVTASFAVVDLQLGDRSLREPGW